ncbi:metal transporter [Cupriavidus sp. UYMSc13B]|nr:metal transporter [Cupriavidus sp. UYMSc13B]
MKPRLILFSIVSLALAGGAGWYIHQTLTGASTSAPTAATQVAPQPAVQTVNGETVVVVSPEAQNASHIAVAPVAAVTDQRNISAYATVIDLQPLFDLRNRLAAGRADVATFTAQAANSRAQYERSRTLFEDDRNISQKSLQDARSAMQADEAKLESARATLNGLEAAMRQQFGDAITSVAMTPTSNLLQRLQSGQAVVFRVTLPANYGDAAPTRITVQSPDGRSVPVQKLSLSPQADPAVQGSPWFYVAEQALPAGLRASASVPTSSQAAPRLLIPEQAVVWYGGQTWAYVRTAPDRFTRRYVTAADEAGGGFMVTSGFHAGDFIVTQGAQLLLSEELKPQGIATACKDPPECDD